jgi:dimethylamine/trimethylamine dehydrogenase
MNMGVYLQPQHLLHAIHEDYVALSHAITGVNEDLAADAVVLVTDRLPNDSLNRALKPTFAAGRLDSLRVIGDAEAPNLIAQAVFSGHLAGREFEETIADSTPFRIERVEL